jgi:succinate dehydrogenase/fumarate reductase iron-sulfur protein
MRLDNFSNGETSLRIAARQGAVAPAGDPDALAIGDMLSVEIARFDPATDTQGRFDTFAVPYVKDMRIIDALNHVYETLGVDIGYRWYCGTKKCGTCAVRMNGREVLACWEAAEAHMCIEPLRHAPVIRDLIVDRQPYEDKLIQLKTWLIRDKPYEGFPEFIDRKAATIRSTMDCISCMACYSACPVLDFEQDIRFAGPAPLVHLARVALDPRDGADRLDAIVGDAGVHHCVSCYKCEEVCPAHIPIVSEAIEPLKQLVFERAQQKAPHDRAFMQIVRSRGRIEPMLLVLKTQAFAALKNPARIIRLLRTGKVRPLVAIFRKPTAGIAHVRKYFR